MVDPVPRAARILIVEDKSDTREAFSAVLSLHGYEADVARDGAEGVRIALARRPDLILMDLTMPRLDGLQAARRLRKDPRWKRVPILAVSANHLPFEKSRAVEAVFDEHLVKPVLVRTLLHRLAAHLERAGAQDLPRSPEGGA